MMNPIEFAMDMLKRNPNVRNNANASDMIAAIENNDSVKGEAIANNLLKTYGVTKEQALEIAKQRFGL